MLADSFSNTLLQHAYTLALQIELLQAGLSKIGVSRVLNTTETRIWQELGQIKFLSLDPVLSYQKLTASARIQLSPGTLHRENGQCIAQ